MAVPGDKSISHRAVLFGSIAEGTTTISHFLPSADCLSTIDCMRKLGVIIEIIRDGSQLISTGNGFNTDFRDGRQGHLPFDREVRGGNEEYFVVVRGVGLNGLAAPSESLDAGNSGTTTRLLSGILAGQAFGSRVTGDSSLCRRPMRRIMDPLSQMGAAVYSENDNGCAPLVIGGQPLHGIHYKSPVASAQVKSCVLLAGLYAEGETAVTEPALSRDHTERMLRAFGANVVSDGLTATLLPDNCGHRLVARNIEVPGDISSAAYFLAAGLLVPGSDILLKNVGINPTRDGILRVIEAMGGQVEYLDKRVTGRIAGGEPAADLRVRSSRLHGTTIGGAVIPSLIDEIPVIAVMAAFAEGETVIRDAAELRVKESDRLALITENLRAMGADVTATADGMIIRGRAAAQSADGLAICDSAASRQSPAGLHGTRIRTSGDHRMAMAFAIAGLVTGGMEIDDPDCVAVSYPTFFDHLNALMTN